MGIKIGMVSLGCAKNRVDAELMLGVLLSDGFELETDPAKADAIIVNTCGFIEAAKQESIDTILEMAEYKQDHLKALIVTGCLSKRYAKELPAEMPEVDAFLGIGEVEKIAQVVRKCMAGEHIVDTDEGFHYLEDVHRVLTTPGYTAYVKIAEGCNNRCAFCAIPAIRGNYISRSMENIEREVKDLAAQGVKEIVLIAQDTSYYGLDLYHKPMLAELLERVAAVEGVHWVRALYCYPERIDDELLRVMKENPKVCPYLDIPLQHINDKVLREMHRRTDGKELLGEVDPAEFYAKKWNISDRPVRRAKHFFDENARVPKMRDALIAGNAAEYMRLMNESGRSSETLLTNIVTSATDDRKLETGLYLSSKLLDGIGAWRVHGGGFAGCVQALMPCGAFPAYRRGMEALFGPGSCRKLHITGAK